MTHTIQIVSGINEGLVFEVQDGQKIHLGRNTDNDVVLSCDAWVSGRHAALKSENGQLFLSDLHSTNGTCQDGQQIKSGVYHRCEKFFVIGSTFFALADNALPPSVNPIPIDATEGYHWHEAPLYRLALKYSEDEPFLNSSHVFLALLRQYKKKLTPFFQKLSLDIDLNILKSRIKDRRFFSGKYSWLNRYLALKFKIPPDMTRLITPKAASLLAFIDEQHSVKPMEILSNLLRGEFNLVFPLLDWENLQPNWHYVLEDLLDEKPDLSESFRVMVDSQTLSSLIGMEKFWESIADACSVGAVAVVTGTGGCGVSTTLMTGLSNRKKHHLPYALNAEPAMMLDPKAFMYFNPESALQSYLDKIIYSLEVGGLTVIDHFDTLLNALADQGIQAGKFLRTVAAHKGPVIICMKRDRIAILEQKIGSYQVLDMDKPLKLQLTRIYEDLLNGIKQKIKGGLSDRARTFFLEQVAAADPYNIRGLKEFLDLSAARCVLIDSHLPKLSIEQSVPLLTEACLKEVFEDWRGIPAADPALSSGLVDHEPTLKEIENLFHSLAKHMFKIPMKYSDQSRSFAAPGRTSSDAKLSEMKTHLVQMVSTFQSMFPKWFESFWMNLDPEILRQETGFGNNPKKLWNAYCERTKNINTAYAEDLFHQTGREILMHTLKGGKPPL